MLRAYRRPLLIVGLALLTALAGLAARPDASASTLPRLPAIGALLAGTGWQAARAYSPGGWNGYRYEEWDLRDGRGRTVQLYLASTVKIQRVLHWTGELGYEGEGYLVDRDGVGSLSLPGGRLVSYTWSRIHRLDRNLSLASAVVDGREISARGTDNWLQVGWDILRGKDTHAYLVRLAFPGWPGGATEQSRAQGLLAALLGRLAHP